MLLFAQIELHDHPSVFEKLFAMPRSADATCLLLAVGDFSMDPPGSGL